MNMESDNAPEQQHRLNKLAYSVDDLARATSFGRTFLYSEIKAGRLRLVKKGRRSVILDEDARAWLRGEPTSAA